MSLINTELVRANPRLDGLDREGLKELIKQAKEALNQRHKISDDYYVAGNVMLFTEDHSTGNPDRLPQEGQDLIEQFGANWLYDQVCAYPFSGHSAGEGYSLDDVLKQFKFVKKCIGEFIKAAEEAKQRGADTIVRCNPDDFHYDTLEGYEDDDDMQRKYDIDRCLECARRNVKKLQDMIESVERAKAQGATRFAAIDFNDYDSDCDEDDD